MNFPINHTAFFHFYEQGVSRGGGAEGYAMGGQSEGGGGGCDPKWVGKAPG